MKKVILFLMVFAGMMLIYYKNNDVNNGGPRLQPDLRLMGNWAFVDLDGMTLKISPSDISLMPVVENPTPYRTLPYKWISKDSIKIEYINWGGLMADYFTTRNKVIFHTPDSVTVTDWFYGQSVVDAPIYIDVTIVKMAER